MGRFLNKHPVRHLWTFMLLTLANGGAIVFNTPHADTNPRIAYLHEWYSYYYTHQDNSEIIKSINYFLASGFPASALRKKSLQGFYSQVFKQNPAQSVKWIKQSNLSRDERRPLVFALAQANQLDNALELARLDNWDSPDIIKLSSVQSPLDKKINAVSPDDIAWYWGAFKASGNRIFLEKIVDTLIQVIDANSVIGDETQRTLLQTMNYHIEHDERVKTFYAQRYKTFSKEIQGEIDILLSEHDVDDNELDCD